MNYNNSLCEQNFMESSLRLIYSLPQQKPKHLLPAVISFTEPSSKDLQKTKELNELLMEPYKAFKNPERLNSCKQALIKLKALFKQWVRDVSIEKKMPQADAEKLGGQICTFGSCHLEAHRSNVDIDALCIAPCNIERDDFFSSFLELLKQQPAVSQYRFEEEPFVTFIKINYDGTDINLYFARLSLKEIPDDFDLRDESILDGLDQYSLRSLSACRATVEILDSVPNIANFRLTLNCIKLWAQKHGIYSSALGYFGGVTWAILVARTCQLYPNATISSLIQKFFMLFSHWKWPHPVHLTHRQYDKISKFQVWDPRVGVLDRCYFLPTITPTYPQMNSTFNVSASATEIILSEINNGLKITNEIMSERASWDRLFEAPSFFYSYHHFIVLLFGSKEISDHVKWFCCVESKMRWLILKLENHENITLAHLNPSSFGFMKRSVDGSLSQRHDENVSQLSGSQYCSMWFFGLKFQSTGNCAVDLTEVTNEFLVYVSLPWDRETPEDSMTIEARYVRRRDLSEYLGLDFMEREKETTRNYANFVKGIKSPKERMLSELQQIQKSIGKTQS